MRSFGPHPVWECSSQNSLGENSKRTVACTLSSSPNSGIIMVANMATAPWGTRVRWSIWMVSSGLTQKVTGNKAQTMRFVILAGLFRNLLALNSEESVEIRRVFEFQNRSCETN